MIFNLDSELNTQQSMPVQLFRAFSHSAIDSGLIRPIIMKEAIII